MDSRLTSAQAEIVEHAFRDIRTYTLHAHDDRMLQILAQADLSTPFRFNQRYAMQ